jgi:hypothetical protein
LRESVMPRAPQGSPSARAAQRAPSRAAERAPSRGESRHAAATHRPEPAAPPRSQPDVAPPHEPAQVARAPELAPSPPLPPAQTPPTRLQPAPSAPPAQGEAVGRTQVAALGGCRPYAGDTDLAGRKARVRGTACRDPAGVWWVMDERME